MVGLFCSALLLGLILKAAPGPVFAETVRQSLRGGFRPAFAVRFGSLAGDSLWAVLGLIGVGFLLQLDVLRVPVGILGIIYLLWLARESWQEANQPVQIASSMAASNAALRSGITLSITNPQNVAYWAALGSAMGAVGVTKPTMTHYITFLSAFMLASLLWAFICAGIVAILFRRANMSWSRLTYRACAIGFLLLALAALRNLWQTSGITQAQHAIPVVLPTPTSSAP